MYVAHSFSLAFYTSKAWRSVRREVMRRDSYTCRDCSSRAEECHHIIPLTPSNIDDYSISLNPDNLVGLCHTCHTRITKGYTGDVAAEYSFDDDGNVIQVIKEGK